MIDQVHDRCLEHGINIVANATDGQWSKLTALFKWFDKIAISKGCVAKIQQEQQGYTITETHFIKCSNA